jgi:hypothetical protein
VLQIVLQVLGANVAVGEDTYKRRGCGGLLNG